MKNSVLFKEMNDHEYTQCLKTLKAAEKKYKKDALILSAGDTTTKFGLVLDGSSFLLRPTRCLRMKSCSLT